MLYLWVRMRQQENSLQTVCNGKIRECIFAVMFCLVEVRKRVVLFAVILTANIILFLLESSSFPTLFCYVPMFNIPQ